VTGSINFFASFDWSGWYGFFLALGTTVFGDHLEQVLLVLAVVLFLAILTAARRFLRRQR